MFLCGSSGQWRSQTQAHWARASASGNSQTLYFCSIAICNNALFYALLTSLFAHLVFNTGEDLYCAQVC